MYARVAVASNALDFTGLPQPVANALNEALLERILANGRLVFSSDADALDFVRAIRSIEGLPQGARTRWTFVLSRLKQNGRVIVGEPTVGLPLTDMDALATLRAQWGARTDVAVVATSMSETFGIPADTGVLTDPLQGPDIAMVGTAPYAPALARIHELEQHSVAATGSPREEFWTTVLEPLATNAVAATILDPYLFTRLSDIAHGRHQQPHGGEQVTWLLERLDSVMAGRATVRLIGSRAHVHNDDDAQAIAEFVAAQWGPLGVGRLAKVEILLAENRGQNRLPHDRHIRFSTGSALKIEAGFDRLRDERIWDPSGMWWTYFWQTDALDRLRRDEERGEALARQTHQQAVALSR